MFRGRRVRRGRGRGLMMTTTLRARVSVAVSRLMHGPECRSVSDMPSSSSSTLDSPLATLATCSSTTHHAFTVFLRTACLPSRPPSRQRWV